jgi:hypothetical protein
MGEKLKDKSHWIIWIHLCQFLALVILSEQAKVSHKGNYYKNLIMDLCNGALAKVRGWLELSFSKDYQEDK